MRWALFILLVLVSVVSGLYFYLGGTRSELRGTVEKSHDGKTYLVFADDNGGAACPYIRVDQKRWPHRLHEKGPITPGAHTIDCGGEVRIEVPPGMTFRFDYWGP